MFAIFNYHLQIHIKIARIESMKKQIHDNNIDIKEVKNEKWKVWLALGLAAVLGGAYILYKHHTRHPDHAKISDLKRLIDKSYPFAEQSLCPLTSEKTKTISDENLSMSIHYISQLENKNRSIVSSTRNPFLPPFQKGMMIAQLPPRHRLLYNKFYFFKNHLLIVTQEFEEQTSRLSFEDLKQTLLVIHAINGLFFFNSGPQSGFSQKHKHIQVLPNQAFKLPIVSKILQDIKASKLTLLNYKSKQNIDIHLFQGYEFIHGIVILPQNFQQENLEQAAIYLKKAEDTLYTHLSLLLKSTTFSYNVIGCNKYLLMIPRKSQKALTEIGVNAICFMGSMLIKSTTIFDQVEKLCKPTNILRELTFTQVPK